METFKHALSAGQTPDGWRDRTDLEKPDMVRQENDLTADAKAFAALLGESAALALPLRNGPRQPQLFASGRTPLSEALIDRFRAHIEHLLVRDTAGDECTVAQLGDNVLPGVMLSVGKTDGYLSARFDCLHASQWHSLSDRRFEIAERLAAALETGIQVQVVHSRQPDSQREACAGARS